MPNFIIRIVHLSSSSSSSVFFLDDEFYVDPEYLDHQVNGGVAVLKQKKVCIFLFSSYNHNSASCSRLLTKFIFGLQVVEIDAKTKTVRLNDGWEVSYDKCLLATGGRPRNLPSLDKLDSPHENKVILYRSVSPTNCLYAFVCQVRKLSRLD
jgi:programmed cell death 8 (apoptosis-inducing factor)